VQDIFISGTILGYVSSNFLFHGIPDANSSGTPGLWYSHMIMSAALMGGGIWIIARLKMLVLQV
jgi:hypothetical protein